LDHQDWAAYGALFTDDAIIDFSSHQVLTGQDQATLGADADAPWIFTGGQQLVAFIEPLFAQVTSVHHGHDPQVTVTEPDAAHAIWAMVDRLETPGESFHGYGHYHESYRRVAGQWFISALKLTRLMGSVERRNDVLMAR